MERQTSRYNPQADQRVVGLDRDTVMTQSHEFYAAVVAPAFETLNAELPDGDHHAVTSRVKGWFAVHVYHEARQHSIRYAIRTQRMGMNIRVQSSMGIRDHLGTYSTKTQILFGCKHKPLADISQGHIINGFIRLYERMLPSEE